MVCLGNGFLAFLVPGRPGLETGLELCFGAGFKHLRLLTGPGWEAGSGWSVFRWFGVFSALGWPRLRNRFKMVCFATGFEHFRPVAGPGFETASEWFVSELVLSIFGFWLAQALKLAQHDLFGFRWKRSTFRQHAVIYRILDPLRVRGSIMFEAFL